MFDTETIAKLIKCPESGEQILFRPAIFVSILAVPLLCCEAARLIGELFDSGDAGRWSGSRTGRYIDRLCALLCHSPDSGSWSDHFEAGPCWGISYISETRASDK